MPPIPNDPDKKGSNKKRGRENIEKVEYNNELDDSDNEDEKRQTKKGQYDPKKDDSDDDISDSSNSESTQKTPPPSQLKSSKAIGPNTPSPGNPRRGPAVTDQEQGAAKCLSDFIESEGKEYLQKLKKYASSSEIQSAKELANSGLMLSDHGEKIRKMGQRLLSTSLDRFNKYFKNLHPSSSPDE